MIKYKTTPNRIIDIVKENISSFKNFELIDYNKENIQLKFGQFDFTVILKKENDFTILLINWKFNPIGNQKLLVSKV